MTLTKVFGSTKKCVVEFYSEAGVLTDPSTVTFTVRSPSQAAAGTPGTVHVYNPSSGDVVKLGTGRYRLDVVGDEAGTWWVEAKGTGTVQQPDVHAFIIDPSHV